MEVVKDVLLDEAPNIPSSGLLQQIIGLTTPEYDDNVDQWKKNTLRMRGGKDVLEEIERFTWETAGLVDTPDTEGYLARKAQGTYINFLAGYDEKFAGTIWAQFPERGAGLDLGGLNDTRAEMLLDAADGVGPDARSFSMFFRACTQQAIATGMTYILAEEPAEPWPTMTDEKSGKRPYFVMYPPQQVPFM